MFVDYFELFNLSQTTSREKNYDILQRELLKINNIPSQKAIAKQAQLKDALTHFQNDRAYNEYLTQLNLQQIVIDPPIDRPTPPDPPSDPPSSSSLLGELGSLLLRFGLEAGKTYLEGRQQRAARMPASIAGHWATRDGTQIQIQQNGNQIYLQGHLMGVMMEARGMLQGRNLNLEWRNSIGGVGTAQLTVSGDNKRITGNILNYYQGNFPVELYR